MRSFPLLPSLLIGCILLFVSACSTYVLDEETPAPETENDNSQILYSDTILTTGQLPSGESLWGDQFYVWRVTPTKVNEVVATIITLNEFYDTADIAVSTMNTLEIDHIRGWDFFTEDEAKDFRNCYSGNSIYELNAWLLDNGALPFKHDSGQRYLCANGTKSFAFYSNTISKAGTKKKYYYRGVKTLCIIKQ